jgi:hypothetical protein
VKTRRSNVIEVQFTLFNPLHVRLKFAGHDPAVTMQPLNGDPVRVTFAGFEPPSRPFLLSLPAHEKWPAHHWAFLSPTSRHQAQKQFVLEHRQKFVDDMKA